MASTARATRTSAQHSRLKRRAQLLTDEVGRLGTADLHVVEKASPSPFNVEAFVDRAVDLTRGWEKIAALVALITTNLSGNKSLGALMEIMSRDKALTSPAPEGAQASATLGSLNISELMGMAETLLRTGQLPEGLQVPAPPRAEQIQGGGIGNDDLIEVEATVPTPETEEMASASLEHGMSEGPTEPADAEIVQV